MIPGSGFKCPCRSDQIDVGKDFLDGITGEPAAGQQAAGEPAAGQAAAGERAVGQQPAGQQAAATADAKGAAEGAGNAVAGPDREGSFHLNSSHMKGLVRQ